MLTCSRKHAFHIIEYQGRQYLIDLESGCLKGHTSIFLWLFQKNAHCLTEEEFALIKNGNFFSFGTAPTLTICILGSIAWNAFGGPIKTLHMEVSVATTICLFILSFLMGIVFDFLWKRKDQMVLQELLGDVIYESNIKISFACKRDGIIYLIKMVALGLICSALLFGFGSYLIFYQANPFGYLTIFVGAWIIFGASKKLPKRYNINLYDNN